ncbi:hypothetical protein [Vibrio mediterranei]|uniref:hypothetical protein n=1 Tax=Vibrio mediterranei TaxID=689 RepID=UPI0040685B0A
MKLKKYEMLAGHDINDEAKAVRNCLRAIQRHILNTGKKSVAGATKIYTSNEFQVRGWTHEDTSSSSFFFNDFKFAELTTERSRENVLFFDTKFVNMVHAALSQRTEAA